MTAVIVTFQSAKTIRQTLEAARRCYDQHLLDVVIVDNASRDETGKIIGCEAHWANVILTPKNNGFGRGCNIGFEKVTSPYTIFINPDAVVEPEAIWTMMRFLDQNARVGIVGPAIIEGQLEDSTILQDTGQRPTPGTILCEAISSGMRRSSSWAIVPGSKPCRTGWVCGAAFMVRTELMRRLNGFDQRFFLYWEELDVCKRAEDIGFEIWCLGTALVRHVGAASVSLNETRIAGCIAKHYYQSRYYYMVKHHGKLAAMLAEAGEFLLIAARSMLDMIRGRGLHRLRPRLQAPLFSQPDHMRNEH